MCRAYGARHHLPNPSPALTDALGYLLNAPPALFPVVRRILDHLEFLVIRRKRSGHQLIGDTASPITLHSSFAPKRRKILDSVEIPTFLLQPSVC